jgi:hypothetical protein
MLLLLAVVTLSLAGSAAAQAPPSAPLPEGPQLALPSDRLGKDGDCSSACNVCGCARETDIDRGGAGSHDLNPDGTEGGGAVKAAMATEEACCELCRSVPNAVLYKWESVPGHNCWCSSNKGPITAQGPGTNRRSGSFVST